MKKLNFVVVLLILAFGILITFVKFGIADSIINTDYLPDDHLIGNKIQFPEDFEFTTLKTNQKINSDQLFNPNKLTLINLWASWCPSCAKEMPALHQMKKMGWRIVGVNFVDTKLKAKKFLKQLGNPFEFNVFDPSGNMGVHLGATGTPESLLIDQSGIVRYRHIGVINAVFIEDELPEILQSIQPINF